MPHYQPKADGPLAHKLSDSCKLTTESSLILLDFGAKVEGYCSDMTRVVFYGQPNQKQKKMYETVLSAQEKALKAVSSSPGLELTAFLNGAVLDRFAREVIEKESLPVYPHSLGHGVGLEIHEGFRLSYKKDFVLKPGMVFSIEPATYLPGTGGVRIEDLVVLKEDGIEILSKSSKELMSV